jgi:tetratricopeptide (TPR) repeat protein
VEAATLRYDRVDMRLRSATVLVCTMAGLLHAACGAVNARTTNRNEGLPVEQAKPQEPEPAQPVSAMAYEHYIRARLQLEHNRLEQAQTELRQALAYDHSSPYLHVILGRVYARMGLWQPATEQAHMALELSPESVDALVLEGDSQLRSLQIDQAIETYHQAIALAPKRTDVYVRLSEIYARRNERQKAREILEAMIQANPESAEGFRRLGDLSFEDGNEQRAEENYRRVLQLEPSDTQTIRTLASLLEQQGRYREAIQVFIDALESSPEDPAFMAYMARLYLKDNDPQSAQAYLDQLKASDPANARFIAQAYAEINRHAEAIRELESLLKQFPHRHRERLLLAILYEERKQWSKAMEHLKQIEPNSRYFINALTNVGYCLLNDDKPEAAIGILESALKLAREKEDIGRIYQYLAGAFAKTRRFEMGLEFLDKAMASFPDLTDLLEAKANLLYQAGKGAAGVRLLEQAVQKRPQDIGLLYSLGALHEQMGQADKSIEVMRRLLELEPHNASALNFIGYTLADQGKELDEAERLIRRALLLNPGNGAITDSLGWVLYQRGRYRESLEYLMRADRTTPGEAVIIMHMGDAYLKLGQRKTAIEQYKKALESDPEPRDVEELKKRFLLLHIEFPTS